MKVYEIAETVDSMVPLKLAQDWDNVGLLLGDRDKEISRVLLAIDVTRSVLAEAVKAGTDMIISYHPVIWDGLKKIHPHSETAVVYDLIRRDIPVFSIHTALDVATGGVNDGLAEMVGIEDGKPIGDYVDSPAGDYYKLVVFIPAKDVDGVAEAIFAAGAGHIGNYSKCSYSTEGMGTFLPMEGARPAVGKKGRFETVAEFRFETIVPAKRLVACIEAMKNAHPYETPAFDCYRLGNPKEKFGLGRIGRLAAPASVKDIIERIKKGSGARAFGVIGSDKKKVKTAAVCAGSCGSIINSVIAAGADLYLTGELKHHLALAAQEAGLTCICLSHTVSERFILKKFAAQLRKRLDNVQIKVSRTDADPFKWMNL